VLVVHLVNQDYLEDQAAVLVEMAGQTSTQLQVAQLVKVLMAVKEWMTAPAAVVLDRPEKTVLQEEVVT
jgi:hypothetical protein